MNAGKIICLTDHYLARHLKNNNMDVLKSGQRFELLRRADQASQDLKQNISEEELEKLRQFWIAKELGKDNYYCLPETVFKTSY